MRSFCAWLIRARRWVLLFAGLTSVAGAYYSALLYMRLKPDVQELLPTNARSVIDLYKVTGRLMGIDSLNLVIQSDHPEQSKRFVDALAVELKKLPPTQVASVEYRISDELNFFKRRQALFLDLQELKDIRQYIEHRIQFEKELYNPLTIFRSHEIPEPKYDFESLLKKYMGQASLFGKFPDGYFASADGKTRIVLIYLAHQASQIPLSMATRDAVRSAVENVDPARFSKDLKIHYSGPAQDILEEQASLIADLELSTVLVMILCGLAMYFYYVHFSGTMALLISLFVGTLWTFGISFFAVGFLNANSAFLGSIVIGNGINFGIIYLARYLEERRLGRSSMRANLIASSGTATSTIAAALAAGLSYGSLMLTDFRGFKQFGVIGLIGMLLCWISAFVVLPPLLHVWDKTKSFRVSPWMSKSYTADALAWVVQKFHRPIWILTLIACGISFFILATTHKDVLENDLSKLRDKTSLESGSGFYGKMVDSIFERVMAPAVLLPDTRKDAATMAAQLRKEMARDPAIKKLIVGVRTIDDFLPPQQNEKIQVLSDINRILSPKLMKRLPESDRALAKGFLTPEAFSPIGLSDLPEMVQSKFRERSGAIGNLVVIDPPIECLHWSGDELMTFVRTLRKVADSVAPATPVAGPFPITADMYEVIARDGPKATLFAFLAVIILVTVLFRSPRLIVLCLFSLMVGIMWMAAAVLFFDIKINFLNFIAFPITFGIGVDYGVNLFQRYRLEGRGQILTVLRGTGGAVALASLTTIIGYGSLLIAGNQAFVSFGLLAVLGEITCLIAAIVAFPSFLYLRDLKWIQKDRQPQAPKNIGFQSDRPSHAEQDVSS